MLSCPFLSPKKFPYAFAVNINVPTAWNVTPDTVPFQIHPSGLEISWLYPESATDSPYDLGQVI